MLLFNRYEYDPQKDLLGKGGFSKVFKAFDKKLNRLVALKIYKSEGGNEKYGLVAEIQRIIDLDHPNICRYIDIEEISSSNAFGENEISQVCILELLNSGDLKSYLQKNEDTLVRTKLLVDVLKGLSYLHKNGIIHRDIKPQNILIKQNIDGPVAKITDFGISKKLDSVSKNSSSILGSIEYMAPEQFNNIKYGINGKIGPNLDLWSFGVMIYELLTENTLFGSRDSGSTTEQLMNNILHDEILNKIDLIEEPFGSIIAKCLQRDANKRIQSADELIVMIKSQAELSSYVGTIAQKNSGGISSIELVFANKVSPETSFIERPEATTVDDENKKTSIAESKKDTPIIAKQTRLGYTGGTSRMMPLILLFVMGLLVAGVYYLNRKLPGNSDAKAKADILDAKKLRMDSLLQEIDESMIKIARGQFVMGSFEGADNECMGHMVTIDSFSISKYEITQSQWIAVMDTNPSHFTGCSDCPVENVSWMDIQTFIKRLNDITRKNYRLPSEAEWEFVAWGGNNSQGYIYSGSNDLRKVGWFNANSEKKTHKVGEGKLANELGVFNMSGNVWEWCNDWYSQHYYSISPSSNPKGPVNGDRRVLRGGSWSSPSNNCFLFYRYKDFPQSAKENFGFRLALDV